MERVEEAFDSVRWRVRYGEYRGEQGTVIGEAGELLDEDEADSKAAAFTLDARLELEAEDCRRLDR